MTWKKVLWPLAAALAVPACSFPCDKTGEDRGSLKTLSGTGEVVIECKSSGEKISYPTPQEWRLSAPYNLDTRKHSIEAQLSYQPGPNESARQLAIVFDSELADGTYALDSSNPSAPVKLEGILMDYTGTVVLSRGHDLPFVDVSDPEPGEYDGTLDLTLQLQGTTGYEPRLECPESKQVTVAPTRFQLRKRTVVGTCTSGDVLQGLSEIKGGGH